MKQMVINLSPMVVLIHRGEYEISLRSTVTTHLNAKVTNNHNTSNGLVFLATSSYEGITGDGIQLESGTAELGSRLLITQTDASGSDLADHILLEDSLDVNINQSVTKDTYTALGYSNNNFTRDSLVNISDDNSLDTIVLEGQELGTFKQEDGTTVTGTYGDDILLEDYTGFGVGGKLSLEKTFIALEESLNTGELPFGIYDTTTLVRYGIPSDIFIRSNGMLAHEDGGDFIVYDTAVDENDQIILEDGTDLDFYIELKTLARLTASRLAPEAGFSSGTTTFDSATTFDVLKI